MKFLVGFSKIWGQGKKDPDSSHFPVVVETQRHQHCARAHRCCLKMWNTLQVFNPSHKHSQVKQSALLPGRHIWQHWDVCSFKTRLLTLGFWFASLSYCLIVIALARFYYIPPYIVVYASYNDRIHGGIWGYEFLISVSMVWKWLIWGLIVPPVSGACHQLIRTLLLPKLDGTQEHIV